MIGSIADDRGITVLALMTGVLATGFAQEERRREYLRVWEQVARGADVHRRWARSPCPEIVEQAADALLSRRASSWCGAASPAIRCSSSPSGEVEVRLPDGGSVRLGEGGVLRRDGAARTPAAQRHRWRPPGRPRCSVLYASDFYEIAVAHPRRSPRPSAKPRRPAAARAKEPDASRAQRQTAHDTAPLRSRHRHWPGPLLRLYRGPSRGFGRALRPLLAKAVAMSLITPVILVGGSGKRLWPLSRESMPKQFVPLAGQAIDLPADPGARRRPRACSPGR